jgi:hypothetical protein
VSSLIEVAHGREEVEHKVELIKHSFGSHTFVSLPKYDDNFILFYFCEELIHVLSTLNLWDTTSQFRAVAIYVTADFKQYHISLIL